MKVKHILFTAGLVALFTGCNKDDQAFRLKTVTLNAHREGKYPGELLSIRIVDAADTAHVLGTTKGYPANLPLPVTLSVSPNFKWELYKQSFYVQLLGDSTGLIGSCKVNMDNYKIIFPLEMEVESEAVNVTLSGKWD
ncbi:MAG TPA: hypothetical protein VFS25_00550 [Chitinophaga sp.]|uniref:hypothetical protein n=1 Tax=Chitinophaga sp. TaxID=1869181 RepID=UPI002DB98341|nr:hypothetical protein [Chitinophaga sp.]HEU4551283.1 hypothetical protein [Chitinophaga sp.]